MVEMQPPDQVARARGPQRPIGPNHRCNALRSDCGTVFQLTPPATAGGAWTHTIVGYFNGSNGSDPEIAPVFLLGSLYGTGDYGGSANLGAVFQFTP